MKQIIIEKDVLLHALQVNTAYDLKWIKEKIKNDIVLGCVHLVIKKDYVQIESSDGNQLKANRIKHDNMTIETEYKYLFDMLQAQTLIKMLKNLNCPCVTVFFDEKYLKINNIELILTNGNFPNVNQFIPDCDNYNLSEASFKTETQCVNRFALNVNFLKNIMQNFDKKDNIIEFEQKKNSPYSPILVKNSLNKIGYNEFVLIMPVSTGSVRNNYNKDFNYNFYLDKILKLSDEANFNKKDIVDYMLGYLAENDLIAISNGLDNLIKTKK